MTGKLYAYTDGSCRKNGGDDSPGGWGYFYGPSPDPAELYVQGRGSKRPTTNNEMELTALLRLLEVLPDVETEIRIDSQYVIKSFVDMKTPSNLGSGWIRGWLASSRLGPNGNVKNRDLMLSIWELFKRRKDLRIKTTLVWVKGHSGDVGNDYVDFLAVEGYPQKKKLVRE